MKKVMFGLIMFVLAVCANANDTYKDGTQCNCDTILRMYSESGDLLWETPYKNDKKNGIEKEYYESGALMSEMPFENGKRDGIEKGYYESGALWGEIPYKNGKENGIEKGYYESGEIASTATYRNGILQGYKHCSDGRIGNDDLDCSVQ